MSDVSIAPVIAAEAVNGIGRVMEIAPVVAVLVLVILGGYVVAKRIIEQCERREARADEKHDAVLKSYKEDGAATREALGGVTDALKGVELTIARLDGKLYQITERK